MGGEAGGQSCMEKEVPPSMFHEAGKHNERGYSLQKEIQREEFRHAHEGN